jgi:PilZ domain-containing protein
MSPERTNQRAAPRFRVRIPISARITNGKALNVQTHTENVSHGGLYFFSGSEVGAGSAVEFTLTLPPEVTLTDSIPVSGRGKVVRVENSPSAVGIAVRIDAYDLDS